MKKIRKILQFDLAFRSIGSRWFLITVLAVFCLSAAWLAFSLNTRGSYDEAYHLTIISIYKTHLSPFITTQLPAYDVAGDVTRLPSYLYHYLMSWPARGIALLTHDIHMQVFFLRLINIAFFASALIIYRRVLLSIGLGKALVNATVLFLTLIPLSVQLSATVNYDNLLFLVSGLTILTFIKLVNANKVSYGWLMLFLSLGMVGSLVKYTFLPLYLPLFVYAGVKVFRRNRGQVWVEFKKSGSSLFKSKRWAFISLGALFLLSGVLFVERYGVNLVKYHAITPRCEKLIAAERCAKYYVWQRNATLLNTRDQNHIDTDVFVYTGQWLKGMSSTPFFPQLIVDDAGMPLGPLPYPVQIFQILIVVGAGLLLMGCRFLAQNKIRLFLLLTAVFYVIVLFMDNYHSYLTYHVPVATSGRYLLVVLPLLVGLSAYVLNRYLLRRRYLSLGVFLIVMIMMLQGGGAMTDILRGQRSWFWDKETYDTNVMLKHIIEPVVKERSA